jgi:Animal haem peroxidase
VDSQTQPKKLNLTHSKYRSIDGSGNNLINTKMGSSFTSFGRFLKASYDDNIHSIRKSIRGYTLPSPRNIVRKLFLNDEVNLNKFNERKSIPNHAALMFGQYISHDVSSKQTVQYVDGGNRKFLSMHLFKND